MTITASIDAALEQAKIERAANTARMYRHSAAVFCDYLKENGVDLEGEVTSIPFDLLVRLPSWLIACNELKQTAGVYMAGVRYIIQWMIIAGVIDPTASQMARLEKAIESARFNKGKHTTRTPQKGDADKMLTAVRIMPEPSPRLERNIAMILFLSSSGCRNNEVVKLKIGDLDMTNCQVFIRQGKGDKDRYAWFSQETAQALIAYWTARGHSGKNDPVFARHDRGAGHKVCKPITTATVRDIVEQVKALAGVSLFTPHYFRHSFAITALEKTGNLALVQDLLGHASPTTTRKYAEIYSEDLKQAHHEVFG